MASEYERIRLRNIEDNKRILAELGIVNPFKPLPRIVKSGVKAFKRKSSSALDSPLSKRIKVSASLKSPEATDSWRPGIRRQSLRLLGQEAPEVNDLENLIQAEDQEAESGDEEGKRFHCVTPKYRPHLYGAIPDVEVGTQWLTRMEANHAGVHRPTVAGIHPGPEGAYSLALSGGYEDDIDLGECFTYTGEGGRDLKGTKSNPKNLRTAPQSRDQTLSRGNKALVESVSTGHPVRVLRGYKLNSPFAPEEGYRYDGLYKVDKWWYTTGMAGFGVYKFVLSRIKNQPSAPWIMNTESSDESHINGNSTEEEQADNSGNARNFPEDQNSKTMDLVEKKSANTNHTDINDNVPLGETSETRDKNIPKVTEAVEEGSSNDESVKFEKISSDDVPGPQIITSADVQDDKIVQAAEHSEKGHL